MNRFEITGRDDRPGITGGGGAFSPEVHRWLKEHGISESDYRTAVERTASGKRATGADVLSADEERFLERNPHVSRERYLAIKREEAIPAEHRESVREMELTEKAGIILDDVTRQIAAGMPGGLEGYCRSIEREQEREKKAAERKSRIETSSELSATDKEYLLRHTETDLDGFLRAAREEKKIYKPTSKISSW